MNDLLQMITIADIHVDRIRMAMDYLASMIPFNAEKVQSFTQADLLFTDLLVHRFGKLQDLIGAKIIHEFLVSFDETITRFTMLDKINLLERIEIIENAQLWKDMRTARNHSAHEYPDEPALTAKYLNEIIYFAPKLIEILDNIKRKINYE